MNDGAEYRGGGFAGSRVPGGVFFFWGHHVEKSVRIKFITCSK